MPLVLVLQSRFCVVRYERDCGELRKRHIYLELQRVGGFFGGVYGFSPNSLHIYSSEPSYKFVDELYRLYFDGDLGTNCYRTVDIPVYEVVPSESEWSAWNVPLCLYSTFWYRFIMWTGRVARVSSAMNIPSNVMFSAVLQVSYLTHGAENQDDFYERVVSVYKFLSKFCRLIGLECGVER